MKLSNAIRRGRQRFSNIEQTTLGLFETDETTDTLTAACALGFALLGSGYNSKEFEDFFEHHETVDLAPILQVDPNPKYGCDVCQDREPESILELVTHFNDEHNQVLDTILEFLDRHNL